MNRMALVLALALSAVSLTAAEAEAQLAGGWSLELGEWQAGEGRQLRAPGGNAAEVQITVRADSAFATYTSEGTPPLEMKGLVRGNAVTLAGTREARVNRNGEESTVTLTIELELTATGGEATGQMRMLSGADPPATRTVKGRLSRGEE